MTPDQRIELLRMVATREPERSTRDIMSLAESLAIWIETRRFPEEAIADCTADHRPV
jgi:hypothetical protein